MTIDQAIARIDVLKPNQYTTEDKISWLSILDGIIFRDIIATHEDAEIEEFEGYTSTTDFGTELLAYAPYDEMYIHWLDAKVDYYNREYTGYNNGTTAFTDLYNSFQADYNRHHMPVGTKVSFY